MDVQYSHYVSLLSIIVTITHDEGTSNKCIATTNQGCCPLHTRQFLTCGGVSRDAPLDAVLKAPVSLFFVQECPSDGLHRIAMASNLIKLLVTSSDALATSSVHVTSSVALVTRCKAFKRARPLT